MNILRVLLGNLKSKPMTLRYPREVPHPGEFRGPVKIDLEKCISCRMCDYVCVSNAVEVTPGEDSAVWSYYPSRCTFCAKCLQVCPTGALSMLPEKVWAYADLAELDESHRIEYPPCPRCGRINPPLDESILALAFQEVTDDMREWFRLCPRCRRKVYVKGLSAGVEGARPPKKSGDEK